MMLQLIFLVIEHSSVITMALVIPFVIQFFAKEPIRLDRQRQYISSIRQTILKYSSAPNSKESTPKQNNDNGFHLRTILFSIGSFVIGLSFLYEGNIVACINIHLLAGLFLSTAFFQIPQASVLWIYRFNVLHQLQTIWFFRNEIQENWIRRAVLMRGLSYVFFMESLEESLLYLVALMICLHNLCLHIHGGHERIPQHIILLPLKFFFFAVLPLRVLGVSDWINPDFEYPQVSQKTKKFLRGILFLSAVLPMCIMFCIFADNSSRLFYTLLSVSQTLLAATLQWTSFGPALDQFLSPNAHQTEEDFEVNHPNTFFLFRNPLIILLLIALRALQQEFLSFIVLLIRMIVLVSGTFESDHRLFSQQMQTVCLFSATVHFLWSDNLRFNAMVLFLTLSSTVLSVLVICSQEIPIEKIRLDREADSFVSHAIKQKFAAVGVTVEQILLERPDQLLSKVLVECHVGHDRCHASNIYRRLEDGEMRKGKQYYDDLPTQLLKTTLVNSLLPRPDLVVNNLSMQKKFCVDWEVFHVMITEWCVLGAELKEVQLSKSNSTNGFEEISLVLDRAPINRHSSSVVLRLGQELDGLFFGNVFRFQARFRIQSSSVPGFASPSLNSRQISDEFSVFSSLKIAILDDNQLIRSNFIRLFVKRIGSKEDNVFARGITIQECQFFPHEILLKSMDIAIFDQNLDFDDLPLTGSDLAIKCKNLGFSGCLILHSSDPNMVALSQQGVFDGCVEKSANASQFLGGVLSAWNSHQMRKLKD